MPGPYALFADETGLPHTTRRDIPYEIDWKSYVEEWVEGANQTRVICRVKTSDAPSWVEDMVGKVYVTGTAPNRKLRRYLPEASPFYPNQWCMRVEQIEQGGDPAADPALLVATNTFADADPSTGASAWPVALWMRFRCTFQGLPFQLLADNQVDDLQAAGKEAELNRYLERRRVTIAREQQFPGGAFKTVDDGNPANRKPLQQTGFRVVSMADVEYRIYRWPVDSLQLTALKSLVGTVNSARFDFGEGGYDWDPGTLLYTGFDDNLKTWDPDGVWVINPLIIRFRSKEILDAGGTVRGWNYFLNNQAQPILVSLDGTSTGQRPYKETPDFVKLFRVEP